MKMVKEVQEMEIRILNSGFIELKGKVPYNIKSDTLFSREHKAFFVEKINEGAFTSYFNKSKKVPSLIFNHDMNDNLKVVSFNYEDTEKAEFKFTYVVQANKKLLSNINNLGAMSFGFVCGQSNWHRIDTKGIEFIRSIKEFNQVNEFSILIGKEACYKSAKIYIEDEPVKSGSLVVFTTEVKEFIQQQRQNELNSLS